MIKNGMDCPMLNVQHRMRPEISCLITPLIYPDLRNHDSVHEFESVRGVKKNVFFIDHKEYEQVVSISFCEKFTSETNSSFIFMCAWLGRFISNFLKVYVHNLTLWTYYSNVVEYLAFRNHEKYFSVKKFFPKNLVWVLKQKKLKSIPDFFFQIEMKSPYSFS